MASAINLLRANDLIWSFVVKNYLLGEEPFPSDLLYWNSDSTRMSKKTYGFYLRNMYLNNQIRERGGISPAGQSIDLSKFNAPAYFVSTIDDHIAPWASTYDGSKLLGGPVQFVLGGSGHIARAINPASSRKYRFRTNNKQYADANALLTSAKEYVGSWWPHWFEWATAHAGPEVDARSPGDGDLVPIEDVPGSYVKVRIEE